MGEKEKGADMPGPQKVELTNEEAVALYRLLDELSGGNAANVFAWDGSDNLSSPTTSACAKVLKAAGRDIPEGL